MRSLHAILLTCVVVAACAVLPARADHLTPGVRADDPRLETPVRYATARAYVAEVLQALTAATGVDVRADDRSGATDELVCVRLDGVPLADALEALRTLFSYRGAEWRCLRDGGPGAYRYTLARSLAAPGLGDRLRRESFGLLARQADLLMEAARLPVDERGPFLERAGKGPFGSGDESYTLKAVRHEGFMQAIRVFGSALTPDRRRLLFGDGGTVQVPVAELGPEGRATLEAGEMGQWGQMNPDRTRTKVPPPAAVTFEVRRWGDELGADFAVSMGEMGGVTFAGGPDPERHRRKVRAEHWMLPGDVPDDPRNQTQVDAPDDAVSAADWPGRSLALARGARLSLAARLPPAMDHDPGSPRGATVAAWLAKARTSPRTVMSKWRGPVLLLEDMGWYNHELARVPWAAYRRLHDPAAANAGVLPMSELFWAAATLNDEQVRSLEGEIGGLGTCIDYRDLFALCHREPMTWALIRSDRGWPLTPERLALLDGTLVAIAARERGGTALRATVDDRHRDGPLMREVTFGVIAGGRWEPVEGALIGRGSIVRQ